MKMNDLILGTDPEAFIYDTKMEMYVKASGIIPGNKEHPFPVKDGAVQVDGVAAEFNIHPATSAKQFDSHIASVLDQLRVMINSVDHNLELVFSPVADFQDDYWHLEIPEEDKVLGCSPDFNFEGGMNTIDPLAGFRPFRTAAGHIHIGWGNDLKSREHFNDCMQVSKSFFNDQNATFFHPRTDDEQRRISFYGGNGAFRNKSYGVELRSPSNRWVENRETRLEMYDMVVHKMEREFRV